MRDGCSIEEYAEGGDILAAIARENPRLLEGFSRVCEGGGVALYRTELNVCRSSTSRLTGDQNLMLNVSEIVEPAEIDLVARESLVRRQLALGLLIADFTAEIPRAEREPDTAEDDRTGGAAVADVGLAEDRRVEVDELAALRVAPPEQADAAADVRLHGGSRPSGRKRNVAVNGTMRSLNSCSISLGLR